MSKPYTEQIECPSCKQEFTATCWESLNAELNPEEKAELLSGTLFNKTCPQCNKMFTLEYPILYHDMTHKMMVWLTRDDNETENIKTIMETAESLKMMDEMALAGYRLRFVRSQDELREKALIFDCGLDDRVIEFLKVIFHAQFLDKQLDTQIIKMFFYNEPSYRILIYCENGDTFDAEFDEDLHNSIMERKQERFDETPDDIIFIDQEWAVSLFNGS